MRAAQPQSRPAAPASKAQSQNASQLFGAPSIGASAQFQPPSRPIVMPNSSRLMPAVHQASRPTHAMRPTQPGMPPAASVPASYRPAAPLQQAGVAACPTPHVAPSCAASTTCHRASASPAAAVQPQASALFASPP
eukprot:597639-Pleurochrysis_carterae.AAC.1